MDATRCNETAQYLKHTASGAHWQRISVAPRRGICVPLFSLRSDRDCGVGDTGDLRAMVDWCADIGMSVLQILPINDMGLDGCPYAALSAFAIDPVFIAVDAIDAVAGDVDFLTRLEEAGKQLNRAERIDYQAVRQVKMAFLEEAFARADGPALEQTLYEFRAGNKWLDDYLPYRVLKETNDYRSWENWGLRFANPDQLQAFEATCPSRIRFHCFLQWVAFRQFSEVRDHASARGVLIKGDIPILVSRDSADVWRHPEYFDMETAAGAPPDMYSQDGQYWGFPTYNWDRLRQDDFGWWRARLRYAENFFDLYRIDHVVGFFRIWTIKLGAGNGREGWYVPWDEGRWGQHGRELLQMMLQSTHMLPLAEDLGTIPHVCRDTLTELGICGLKVQRWEKRWEGDASIIPPSEYPPLSVATLSTHDSETLAGWWQAYPEDRNQLWHFLGCCGDAPDTLDPEVHLRLVRMVADGNALFAIFMLQDLLAPFGLLNGAPADHRINVPGTVSEANWSWRCPVTLKELAGDTALASRLEQLFSR